MYGYENNINFWKEKSMKALVLAGGLPQIKLINDLKKRGITTVLLDGNNNAIARPYADVFYQAAIFDIEVVKEIAIKEEVDFLITVCADQVLLVVAQVSEMLGLPCYIDYQTAINVSDKTYMKKIFKENNIPTSNYVQLADLDLEAIKHLKYPLVVKPVDAYSSKGVRKVWNENEIDVFFKEASEISRSGEVIIEEFCDGDELSVDAFVEDGKVKILCVSNSEKILDDNRFVIFRGRYPICATESILEKIQTVAQQIADAFKLENCPLLIQMINDGKKVSVLEFCARTGGNMKYMLIDSASGVDVIEAVIDLTLGIKPKIEIKEPIGKYIVNDFLYCKPGVFDHLEGFDEMVDEGMMVDYKCLRPKGTKVVGVNSSSDRIAGIQIVADSVEDFNEKQKHIAENIKIIDCDGNDMLRHDLITKLK